MNLAQIIDVLPLQVYLRRGELAIHFSTSADLVNRLAETSAAISELQRQTEGSRMDAKPDRAGRRGSTRPVDAGGARSESDAEGSSVNDSDQPTHSG